MAKKKSTSKTGGGKKKKNRSNGSASDQTANNNSQPRADSSDSVPSADPTRDTTGTGEDSSETILGGLAEYMYEEVGAGEYQIKDEDNPEEITINDLKPYDWYQIEVLFYKLKASGCYGTKASRLWVRAFIMFLGTQDKTVIDDGTTELN